MKRMKLESKTNKQIERENRERKQLLNEIQEHKNNYIKKLHAAIENRHIA